MGMFQSLPFFAAPGVACALLVIAGGATAQDLSQPKSIGACTPRDIDAGPWSCRTKDIESKCQERTVSGYDEIWKLTRNEEDAKLLLGSMYSTLNDAQKFSQWLACQGFDLNSSGVAANFIRENPNVTMWITASYPIRKSAVPFPLPWFPYLLSYSGDLFVGLDAYGKIIYTGTRYTTE